MAGADGTDFRGTEDVAADTDTEDVDRGVVDSESIAVGAWIDNPFVSTLVLVEVETLIVGYHYHWHRG